mgnify:CR=1 FL=1
MRKLTAVFCLAAALLMGGTGISWGADFQKGLDAYDRGDYATALREWTPFAEQGIAEAQFFLGLMYSEGQGVPQDYKAAAKWFRLAAEQGNAYAQYNLGLMHYNGESVPQDYIRAHMWLNIAAANGYEAGVTFRDAFAKHMSPTDILVAQRLARECMAKDYKGC